MERKITFDNSTIEKRMKMSITRLEGYTKSRHSGSSSSEDGLFVQIPNKVRRRSTLVVLKQRLRKIVAERLTVKQIFRQFVDSSTLHGFRYTCSDTYFIRRVFWALLMILGFVYFLVKLKEGILEYLEYQFTTLDTVDFVDLLYFPAISFCPINNFKLEDVKRNGLKTLYLHGRLPLDRNWSDPGYDINGNEFVSLLESSVLQIEDILQDCEWIKRNTDHFFMDRNICGGFNFTSYFNKNLDLCFTVNPGTDNHPLLHVDQAGLRFGYEFLFDLKLRNVLNVYGNAGIRVVLHHPSEPPVFEEGFYIAPGFKTFVSMELTETKSLPPPYATKCGKTTLQYFTDYSQKKCMLERLTDYVSKLCNCREPYMPDNGFPYCSLRQTIVCVFSARETFNDYEMRENCPVDCDVTTYSFKLSDALLLHDPPKGLEPILLQRNALDRNMNETHLMKLSSSMSSNELDQYIENNLVNVIFFYHEMKKYVVEQDPTFDFYQFLGDMGGEIGLMLGASLLTFFEFIDLFVFLVYHQLLRLNKKSQIISVVERDEEGHEEDEEDFPLI